MWDSKYREDLLEKRNKAKLGGGQKRIDKQHELGKHTAWERIEMLFDPVRPAHQGFISRIQFLISLHFSASEESQIPFFRYDRGISTVQRSAFRTEHPLPWCTRTIPSLLSDRSGDPG